MIFRKYPAQKTIVAANAIRIISSKMAAIVMTDHSNRVLSIFNTLRRIATIEIFPGFVAIEAEFA